MHRLAVCSWSLRPRSVAELVARVRECGLRAVQIALDPVREGVLPEAELVRACARQDLVLVSGMMAMAGEDYGTLDSIRVTGGVRPDATWPANLANARANAALARRLGLRLVTFHAGFLPHARSDPERARMLERLRVLAEVFAEQQVGVAFETGQEDAATLLEVLRDLDGLAGVNFDPANMLLYGMGDPVAALRLLAPHVRQVHVKDALPAPTKATWGREVPVGTGGVDWASFAAVLRERVSDVDLCFEREAGESRVADVAAGLRFLRPLLPRAR